MYKKLKIFFVVVFSLVITILLQTSVKATTIAGGNNLTNNIDLELKRSINVEGTLKPGDFTSITKSKEVYEERYNEKSGTSIDGKNLRKVVNKVSNRTLIKNPDVNYDYKIDILDLAKIATLYNVTSAMTYDFNENYDLNNDNIIDVYDMSILARRIGNTIKLPAFAAECNVNDTVTLPSYVEVQLDSNFYIQLSISWDKDKVTANSAGVVNVNGTIRDYYTSVKYLVTFKTATLQNSNAINLGLTYNYNDKIYYGNPANSYKLSVSGIDGSNVKKLCEDSAFYINVINDWIYYVNYSDNRCIYKIKIDGTGRTKIGTNPAEFVNISNGWIYYSNGSDYYSLYKIRLDGSENTKINDQTSLYASVYGNYIYFCDYSTYILDDNGRTGVFGYLLRQHKDTGEQELVAEREITQYTMEANRIYYLNDYGIMCINLELGNEYNISDNAYYTLNTDGKNIYATTDLGIFKYNIYENSTVPAYLDDSYKYTYFTGGRYLNISGNNLFYCPNENGEFLYKASTSDVKPTMFGVDSNITKLFSVVDRTYQGDLYNLPKGIPAQRGDGSVFQVPVNWDVKTVDTSTIGSYIVEGTVSGFSEKVNITVKVLERGNSNQNLFNNGYMAEKNGYIYFRSPLDKKFYKMKADETEKTLISGNSAKFINVVGDTVYYLNESNGFIYSMLTNGTNVKQLTTSGNVINLIVDSERIYIQDHYQIRTMNLDGTNMQVFLESKHPILNMNLVGNTIVYHSDKVHLITLNKGYYCALDDDTYYKTSYNRAVTDGKNIFYAGYNGLHKEDMESGQREFIAGSSPTWFNGTGNNIAFTAYSVGTFVANESSTVNVSDLELDNIYFVKDRWIFMDDENKRIYSCNLDGSSFNLFDSPYDIDEITSIENQEIYLSPNANYTLPATIYATRADGRKVEVSIKWNSNNINTATEGTFTYEGTVDKYENKVIFKIIVTAKPISENPRNGVMGITFAARYSDWIVYISNSGNNIYKMKSDGTNKTRLSSRNATSIQIYGDWIYYSDKDSEGKTNIRKVKIDGSVDSLVIENCSSLKFAIHNGWIFYNFYEMKARIDGSEKSTFLTNYSGGLIQGNYIYYTNNYDSSLCKKNLDSGIVSKIPLPYSYYRLAINDNYLFTANANGVNRMNKDGSSVTKILGGEYYISAATNDYLFLSGQFESIRCNADGSGVIKFPTLNSLYDMNIIGDWIYYINSEGIYKIKLDGTQNTKL